MNSTSFDSVRIAVKYAKRRPGFTKSAAVPETEA